MGNQTAERFSEAVEIIRRRCKETERCYQCQLYDENYPHGPCDWLGAAHTEAEMEMERNG